MDCVAMAFRMDQPNRLKVLNKRPRFSGVQVMQLLFSGNVNGCSSPCNYAVAVWVNESAELTVHVRAHRRQRESG
jgi:hypothetical protein